MRASNPSPNAFQRRTLWNAATGVAILVLGALLVALIWLLGKVLGFLQPVLIPIVVAGIIAFVLEPVVSFLERHRFSRLWAVVTVFCAMLLGLMLLVLTILPGIQRSRVAISAYFNQESSELSQDPRQAAEQETQDMAATLAESLNRLRETHSSGMIAWALTEVDSDGSEIAQTAEPRSLEFFWDTRVGRLLFRSKDVIFRTGRNWLSVGSSKLFGFLGLLIGLIMVPIYLFFFLKDSASIRAHWHDYVPLKASRFKTELVSTLQEINGYLVSFFRGQVVVAVIDGLLVGIALTLFGLPYGLVIGVFMAILGVIPYIGNILCLIPACVIAYLHAQSSTSVTLSPLAYVGVVIAIFVIVQQINSLVTAPKIVGDSVGLHPLTVIFSMFFWSLVLGGFVGALLAVPMTAAIKVLFRRYIWEPRMRDHSPALE